MHIYLSDEKGVITDEMLSLMQKAADESLLSEFGGDAVAEGLDAGSIEAGVSVTLVDEVEIKDLNRDYRGNDSVTDVLSFPQFESREDLLDALLSQDRGETLIGDVVMCKEQAERQAEEYGTGIKREMLYLFVHSIMHLFAYDHMNEDDKRLMRTREEEVLHAIGTDR